MRSDSSDAIVTLHINAALLDPSLFQISGFAILIDRRNGTWQDLSSVFYKIISQFPGDIKEVFLLYKYPSGKAILNCIAHCISLLLDDLVPFCFRQANAWSVGRQ